MRNNAQIKSKNRCALLRNIVYSCPNPYTQAFHMLSFKPSIKLEMEMKRLQSLSVEAYKSMEGISSEEARYLNRFAFISNIGASTRIENAVLTDQEIEWVDTALNSDGRITAFEEKKEYILDKLSKDRERSVEEVVGSRQVLTTIYMQTNELFPLYQSIFQYGQTIPQFLAYNVLWNNYLNHIQPTLLQKPVLNLQLLIE